MTKTKKQNKNNTPVQLDTKDLKEVNGGGGFGGWNNWNAAPGGIVLN